MNALIRAIAISAVALALPALAQNTPPVIYPGQEPPPAAAPKAAGGADLGSGQMYARIASNGALNAADSKGVLPCTGASGTCRNSTGLFVVNFGRDVSHCGYSGTLGTAGGYYAVGGVVTVSSYPANPNSVLVTTLAESSGIMQFTDLAFRLVITC